MRSLCNSVTQVNQPGTSSVSLRLPRNSPLDCFSHRGEGQVPYFSRITIVPHLSANYIRQKNNISYPIRRAESAKAHRGCQPCLPLWGRGTALAVDEVFINRYAFKMPSVMPSACQKNIPPPRFQYPLLPFACFQKKNRSFTAAANRYIPLRFPLPSLFHSPGVSWDWRTRR